MRKSNLKNLSNSDLDQNLKSLVGKEREILTEILNHIVEVDARKLYLTYAYPNLFAYLTQLIGYSAGSAQRRIDAARLSREVPEVMLQIEKGDINLAQISLLQKSFRQANLEAKLSAEAKSEAESASTKRDILSTDISPQKISVEIKQTLLSQLAGKSFHESELCVNQALNITLKESSKTSFQKNKSVRLEVTLSEMQWQKLSKAKDLISHSVPSGSLDQVLEYLCDQIIQQKDKTVKAASSKKRKSVAIQNTVQKTAQKVNDQNASAVEPSGSVGNGSPQLNMTYARETIPAKTQREVFARHSCCQSVDQRTKRKCGSTWQLTIDHIRPVWAGGGNENQNLRVLCANHNREMYRGQARIRPVG